MRKLLLALLLVAACSGKPTEVAEPVEFSPVKAALDRTYKVKVDCPGEANDSSGSAVDIGGGYALTANHVVQPWVKGCFIKYEGTDCIGTSGNHTWQPKNHPSVDMALLTTPLCVTPMVGFAKPELGLDVIAVGYPVDGDGNQVIAVTKGNVAGLADGDGEVRFTAPIWYGNSGGGVWDYQGRLVGLSVSSYFRRPGWAGLVPAYRASVLF